MDEGGLKMETRGLVTPRRKDQRGLVNPKGKDQRVLVTPRESS